MTTFLKICGHVAGPATGDGRAEAHDTAYAKHGPQSAQCNDAIGQCMLDRKRTWTDRPASGALESAAICCSLRRGADVSSVASGARPRRARVAPASRRTQSLLELTLLGDDASGDLCSCRPTGMHQYRIVLCNCMQAACPADTHRTTD